MKREFDNYDFILDVSRNDVLTVGTSATSVSDAKMSKDLKRRVILIQNSSTGGQNITVAFSPKPAVAGYGIILTPGQNCSDSTSDGYESWQGSISAISSAAGGSLTIFER